ncbi:hypothetical protein M2140_001214 [Clostridiales Family XIII bacterium PM5-7]
MGKLSKKKVGKIKYPEKTSINLAISDRDAGETKLPVLFFVIFLIVLMVFVKFMVIDKLAAANDARKAYQEMQYSIGELKEQNAIYDEVKADYSHYGNGYLNEEERIEQDRLEIINAISKKVLPKANISSLQISGNVATLTIANTRLSVVSEIVAALEDSDIVSYVNVTTAGTQNDESASVSASMVINFKTAGGEQ